MLSVAEEGSVRADAATAVELEDSTAATVSDTEAGLRTATADDSDGDAPSDKL